MQPDPYSQPQQTVIQPEPYSQPPQQTVIIGTPTVPVVGASPYGQVMVQGGRPFKMMSFFDSIKTCLSNSFNVEGRASRSEYWWFSLFSIIAQYGALFAVLFFAVGIGKSTESSIIMANMFSTLVALILMPAVICVGARRMHDVDKSGWFMLIPIYNLILFLTEGDEFPNRFGPVPTNVIQ